MTITMTITKAITTTIAIKKKIAVGQIVTDSERVRNSNSEGDRDGDSER